MKLLDRWRRRKRERAREAESIDAIRRADEPDAPVPHEAYLSQTRD
jgi:DNA-directed RNA polymerase specialized sigma24 family protein